MKRVILTSAGFENKNIEVYFLEILQKKPEESKALWIPTAAITEEAKNMLPECMKDLLNAGFIRERITVYDLDYTLSYDELKQYDAVYVCGGSCNHLLTQMQKVNFIELIQKYVEEDGIYVGVSAGSCICGGGFVNRIPWLSCKINVHCVVGTPKGVYSQKDLDTVELTNRQALVFDEKVLHIIE